MKYVKVLDKDLRPPIQGGEPYEIGVWHHCKNFDMTDEECAPGFYVIPVSELIHYHNPWDDTKVLPAEVKGNSKIFSADKRRYEYMKLGNPLSDDEIKALCREIEPELGYKLSEALYPVNPLLLPKVTVNDDDIELLKQWYIVRNSVWKSVKHSAWYSAWYSVRDSIRDNVWESIKSSAKHSVWYSVLESIKSSAKHSVRDSVWYSVKDSAWESVWAYIGSLFIIHEQGQYPFQSAVNLWYRGLVPSFDGKFWRLHSGEKAEVVWEEPEIGWLRSQKKEGE